MSELMRQNKMHRMHSKKQPRLKRRQKKLNNRLKMLKLQQQRLRIN